MDQEYHEIYRKMYEEYGSLRPQYGVRLSRVFEDPGSQGELRSAVTRIKSAIDGYVETRDSLSIRPDAKYFLLSNFVQVILIPVIAADAYADVKQLLEDAAADVTIVLDEATQSTADERDEGVSSHDIIQSINNVWYRLKLTDALQWMK